MVKMLEFSITVVETVGIVETPRYSLTRWRRIALRRM